MSDREGTSSINLGLATSLVSRFDLVLILTDERNNEWDTRVANHIFYQTEPEQDENLYDLAKLQAHFSAVKDFNPTISDSASRILKAYYLACRADEERDAGRTTLRFNDSLYRLAKSHAKLLFRDEVTEIDAVLVVMLMESSFGFGRILQPKNVVREDIPFGPSDVQITELMERLNLPVNENRTPRTQVTVPEVSRMASNIQGTQENVQNIPGTLSADTFDVRRFAFERRHLSCIGSVAADEHILTPAPVSVDDSSNRRSQPRTLRPLHQYEDNGVGSSTSKRKRIRLDNGDDDEELENLFRLDDPIPKPTDENVVGQTTVPENSSSTNSERRDTDVQPNRLRIFNNCTDEDLAAFDIDF